MEDRNRSSVRTGLVLIGLGVFFLVALMYPNFQSLIPQLNAPELVLFGVALLLAFIAIVTGSAGMAIPVCILAGIGGIFYWQDASGVGALSWSYAWALIPGFVGVGILIRSVFSGWPWHGMDEGIWLIAISAILFLIFGAAFGNLIVLGPYWPVLLIILGVISLVRNFLRRR
jgi:hypothetical protein